MAGRLFRKPTVILIGAGLALNVLLVWLTDLFAIPLYLDAVGTVIVAALAGALPGIAVGFLSNCLTMLFSVTPDPMTLYYGFLNVLIALVAAWFSRVGLLRKWYGKVAAAFAFSFIGGALGSLITWSLYGFSFGQGISASLARSFYVRFRMGEFPAQFAADMSVDLVDKLLTTLILCAALRFLPDRLLSALPLGYVYRDREKPFHARDRKRERVYRKHSINTKITALIIVSSTVLSVIAVAIGISAYKEKLIAQYTVTCNDAVSMMLRKLDGDDVHGYLIRGRAEKGYAETERDLYDILEGTSQLKYMYVYHIEQDGVHVVFDLDAEGLAGAEPGTHLDFDESFPYVDEVLAGETFPAFVTDDTYGWLLTVYRPVLDSDNRVVAYAAADIDMQSIKTNIFTFFINIVSLLFGVLIFITTFALWYCDRKLLDPLGVLMEQARDFDYDGARAGDRVRDRGKIDTGDELEELFHALCGTEDAIAAHVAEVKQKNVEISRMQRNIIFTLANMVENRDGNTGGHIKRTANYVRLIGERLMAEGLYPETVNEQYVKMLYDSAPLHDIGKIKIPDAILNKPGKLTDAEFAQMKTHTTEGRAILTTSLSEIEDGSWLRMAVDMATYHHEKWNGKGYPEGLSGEAIPLCARIMAVADVFDALVTSRSYKDAFSYEDAAAIIEKDAGTHFDETVARVFLRAETEVRKIMTEC